MPSTSPSSRLSKLASHLGQAPTMSTRPPITCHVLDTMSGTPASSIAVYLTYIGNNTKQGSESEVAFAGETNSDGRVAIWEAWTHLEANHTRQYSMEEVFRRTEGEMRWAMRFETGTYWDAKGVKPFFPEVEIKFVTQGYGRKDAGGVEEKGKHWHVPLLLGPYSYTTYRGS